MTDSIHLPIYTQQIKALLPHRYPFLLVDRVVDVTENGIVAYKNVSINEEFLHPKSRKDKL